MEIRNGKKGGARIMNKQINRRIDELEKRISVLEGELKDGNMAIAQTDRQTDANSLITNHIIDNGVEASIVLNGTSIKYVVSYLVGRNADFPNMIELDLHLSIPSGEISLDINTEMDNIIK